MPKAKTTTKGSTVKVKTNRTYSEPSIFNNFQLNRTAINFIVGILVVIILAGLVISFIRKGSILNNGVSTTKQEQTIEQTSQVKKHTVAKGEDLWSISQQYYKTGYNWVDIAKANNITNPNAINEGQELVIPIVTPIVEQEATASQAAIQQQPRQGQTVSNTPNAITGNSYTVVLGDNLWEIAVRAYGDGYKWVDIARVNKLENPNIIHSGNILTIPR